MNYIAGLSPKAEEYMIDNSNFLSYDNPSIEKIGCQKSDGITKTFASMYDKVELESGFIVPLFEYKLKNNTVAREVIQKNIDDIVFVRLKVDGGKTINWTKKEVSDFIKNFEQNSSP